MNCFYAKCMIEAARNNSGALRDLCSGMYGFSFPSVLKSLVVPLSFLVFSCCFHCRVVSIAVFTDTKDL
jgi:hypothetical protein